MGKHIDILSFNTMYAEDDSPNKINASVGSYNEENNGDIYMPKLIREFYTKETLDRTKAYGRPEGQKKFLDTTAQLTLGTSYKEIVENGGSIIATSGGTQAFSLFLRALHAQKKFKIYTKLPTFNSYPTTMNAAGERSVNTSQPEASFEDMNQVNESNLEKDPETEKVVLLFQGLGHNPTGHHYTYEQIEKHMNTFERTYGKENVHIVFDVAYFGWAGEIEEYQKSMQKIWQNYDNVAIKFSYSKIAGSYRRAPAGSLLMKEDGGFKGLQGYMANVMQRGSTVSAGSDIQDAIAKAHEQDPQLFKESAIIVYENLQKRRKLLTDILTAKDVDPKIISNIQKGVGMFTLVPELSDKIRDIAEKDALYLAPGGRINIGGLYKQDITERTAHILSKYLVS